MKTSCYFEKTLRRFVKGIGKFYFEVEIVMIFFVFYSIFSFN